MTTELFSPKVDYVFKKIFGSESHPQVLISFLNACFENSIIIESVQIRNTEMTKEFIENSFSRLDILATTNHGEVINIEMQRLDEKNMIKRSLYYWSKVFVGAYSGKSQYQALPRTICINILDFNLLKKERSYHNIYNLQHNKNNHLLTDAMELHFIEIPKLTDNDKGMLSRWTAFIDDPNSATAIAGELEIPSLYEAREELARISRDPKEAEVYRQRQNALSDKSNALQAAKEEGEKKGKIETVLRGLKKKFPIEMIADMTGLSIAEIEQIKKEKVR
jgi:predicted transposase/invertase (TIGR01784 family)